MKKIKQCAVFILFLACSGLGFASSSLAAFISPTKIFIHDGQTSASLSITNNSDEALVFTFEWERRVRSEDGSEAEILEEGETHASYHPADPYLVYSPRRVVVEPDETQRVRILVRRPKDMEDGEYRSHLVITSDSVKPEPEPEITPGEFGGVFKIRSSLSIPVMLRTGKTTIDINPQNARIVREGNADVVHVDYMNNSTRSIYGRSMMKCKMPDGNEIYTKSNGWRLYPETKTLADRFLVPDEINASKCSTLDLELFSIQDPEYGEKPVTIIKVK